MNSIPSNNLATEHIHLPDRSCIEETPIASRILASIRAQKLAAKQPPKSTLDALRHPSGYRSIKQKPSLKNALQTLNITSNFFTSKQQRFVDMYERFHLPQTAKAKIGYELVAHMSSTMDHLPAQNIMVGKQSYEVIDATKLSHPIFVHATKMTAIPAILGNLAKFFSNNIKLSTSLFQSGRRFFHCNDPVNDPNSEALIPHNDFYVALGLSIDPAHFFRNYPADVGSPTYNADPAIETKGGNDRVRVENHIKLNRVLGFVGTYIKDLQQRVYAHINKEQYPSAYSDSDRIYRLERIAEGRMFRLPQVEGEESRQLRELRKKTGHQDILLQNCNGMINGPVIYNFRDQVKELVHIAQTKNLDPQLSSEILEVHKVVEECINKSDGLRLMVTNGYPFSTRLIMILGMCPAFERICNAFATLRRWLLPYHLSNFHPHRLTRFLGPTEVFGMTKEYSYNEFEALTHSTTNARPIKIFGLVISRNAVEKLQKSTKGEDIEAFQQCFEAARRQNLKIYVVDTYLDIHE